MSGHFSEVAVLGKPFKGRNFKGREENKEVTKLFSHIQVVILYIYMKTLRHFPIRDQFPCLFTFPKWRKQEMDWHLVSDSSQFILTKANYLLGRRQQI